MAKSKFVETVDPQVTWEEFKSGSRSTATNSASYAKSYRERYEAIQREPDEARKRRLSDELEAYKREMSLLLFGIRRAVDKMRLKYLRASGGLPREAA